MSIQSTPQSRTCLMIWCLVFCLCASLYVSTAQRGASWQDSGMLQLRMLNADIRGERDLALAHPLYIAIGSMFSIAPIGNPAINAGALSALAMAIALANLAVLATRLTGRIWIGLLTAGMYGVMHAAWWLATIAEVYTLNAAFMTGELLLLAEIIRRPRWQAAAALGLLNGLNWCVHNLALLALPVYAAALTALVTKKRLRFSALPIFAAFFLLGASLFVAMMFFVAVERGSLTEALLSAFFGRYVSDVVNTNFSWRMLKVNAGLAALNFLSFALPLSVLGWCRMKKIIGSMLAASLGAITIIECVFVMRYPVPDQFTFLLPSLTMICIASALGLETLAAASRAWCSVGVCLGLFSIIVPPAIYFYMPDILHFLKAPVQRVRELPFRQEARYWSVPWKHNERSAELFATTALREAGPGSVILCDSTSIFPLQFVQQRDKTAADVTVMRYETVSRREKKTPGYVKDFLQSRTVYIVSPDLHLMPAGHKQQIHASQKPGSVLYRLRWTDGVCSFRGTLAGSFIAVSRIVPKTNG